MERRLSRLAYHSRYTLRGGQTVLVIRCRQCRKTFCDRFGTAFYDLKTPEEKGRRTVNIKPKELHEALQQNRQREKTKEFKDEYSKRAGVEGTVSQGVRAFG